ncbi:MAG TPA: D-aminoacyl-tRNA deacylase [Candidatus Margulisiibacteriota bacterium]|nr:D-aminoacyl-tRNA deacylase [Candidatus Margulisiibacteriota bacterium]
MRAVVQRVSAARVTVDERLVGAIRRGLLVLVGIAADDSLAEADWLLDKLLDLRIFENELGKFDKSLRDIHGELLLVSQFTLFADTRKGRRPSFSAAARPEHAIPLYEHLLHRARAQGITVANGEFGAHMQVELTNDGPVTILLDSRDR